MATMFAAEMTERVCSEAMQVFGGYRYPTGNPVERYYRDARMRHIPACAIYTRAPATSNAW